MSLSLVAVMLAAWGLVQGDPARRALVLISALLLGLAAASLDAVLGHSRPGELAGSAWDEGGLHFLQVIGGLVLLSLIALLAAAPHVVSGAIVGLAAWLAWPIVEYSGVVRPMGIAALVAAMVVFAWLLMVRIRPGRLWSALDRVLLDRRDLAGWRPSRDWVPTAWPLVAATAAAAALLVPHLATVLGGAMVAAIAAFVASRQAGRTAWGLLGSVPVLLLLLLWALHLSGPLGGWIPNLIDGPFSSRAAQLMAALTAIAILPLAGLWPLHGISVPVLLAPVAGAVLGTFAVLLVPDGIQWWQPLLAPLALLAMVHAVARRLPAQLLVAAGVFGMWTGTRAGALGGALLLVSAWALVVGRATWVTRLPLPAVGLRLLWLVPIVGALWVVQAGMGTEVAYTVAATATAATGIQIMVGINPMSG